MPIIFTISRDDRDFFCSADGGKRFYVGRQVSYQGRIGLKNDHHKDNKSFVYNPAQYASLFGFWSKFIAPTAQVESRSSFIVINTYDRASFTFGFPQFAAHVADGDFVLFFRDMLERAEAHDYFPNLILKDGRIHSVELHDEVPLESKDSTESLQRYLNETESVVDDREVIAAAKFIHWTSNHLAAQALQVQHGIRVAQRLVTRIDRRVGLDGRAAAICCVAFDILHQGRGGSQTFPRIDAALKTTNPLRALLAIGRDDYPERIKGLEAAIKAEPAFNSQKWSTAKLDFV